MLFIIYVSITLGVTSSINASNKLDSSLSSRCFKRISTGERLVAYDVTRIIEQNNVTGCEQECNIYKCTHFSFGLTSEGNGTCELTTDREISRRQDPNFDLYQLTDECAEGKPTGYEKACYRRIISGKRLHERFIRHSLPCNSLQACQHQCSIEKHFDCQGFNIRLDPARVGRGICELSSIATIYLDFSKDFIYDPEFLYYERDNGNNSPNCGHLTQVPNNIPQTEENAGRYKPPISGGPYYGGDSYGPWSTGYGTVDHGPWGSYGYGSGFYVSNNPSRGPVPPFHSNTPFHQGPYDYAGRKPFPDYQVFPKTPNYHLSGPQVPHWEQNSPPQKFPFSGRRYDRPNKSPTYIIIDADASRTDYSSQRGIQPYRPDFGYLPPKATPPLPPRPLTPPPPMLPPPPPPPPPQISPGSPEFYEPPRHFPSASADNVPGISSNVIGHEVCFQRSHPGFKLNPSTIRGMYEAPTVLECESMCTQSPFKCTGYSFRYSSSSGSLPNCLLTDFISLNPETHLLPDKSCDVYFKMGTCLGVDRSEDTECFLKVASSRKIDADKIARKISVSGMPDCELACLNSKFFTCRSFTFRHGPGIIGESIENCFLSDWPISALSHLDFVPMTNHEVYERGSYGHGCELDVGPPHIGPRPPLTGYSNLPGITYTKDSWGADETWKHFTVSGWPCRIGTECQLNPEAGFWACEVEGGDRAQWDYCCRPNHSCGFSRGYQYPWCYVGEAGPDQWRPCSEFYYPEFGNRYPYKPVQGHNAQTIDSYGPPRDTRPWKFGQEEFGPPSYWPISYLFAESPPNETSIWESGHHNHHHHQFIPNKHISDHNHEFVDGSPKIKFKPCGNKFPFPRAIIQKLDLKDTLKTGDPGEQVRIEENPRKSKNLKSNEQVHDSEKILLGPSSNNSDKEDLKNEIEFFPSAAQDANFTDELSSIKRDTPNKTSEASVSLTNSKGVILAVEKLLKQNAKSEEEEESEKNETLKKIETNYSGFVRLKEIENSDLDTSNWNK